MKIATFKREKAENNGKIFPDKLFEKEQVLNLSRGLKNNSR